jgi:excisionase family DNA binding protein
MYYHPEGEIQGMKSSQPQTPVTELRVLSVRQTAEYMGLHPRTVSELLRRGELVGRRVGKPWKVHVDAIRDYLMRKPLEREVALAARK